MTANEYVQTLLEVKKERKLPHETDEAAAFDVAQLISGSFIYPLYEALSRNDFDMDEITQHLESLYDNENHFGFVYFIFILANAVDITVPIQFTETSANDALVPTLSAAIIEDWLEYAAINEISESNE